jgi:hypothetical protein
MVYFNCILSFVSTKFYNKWTASGNTCNTVFAKYQDDRLSLYLAFLFVKICLWLHCRCSSLGEKCQRNEWQHTKHVLHYMLVLHISSVHFCKLYIMVYLLACPRHISISISSISIDIFAWDCRQQVTIVLISNHYLFLLNRKRSWFYINTIPTVEMSVFQGKLF